MNSLIKSALLGTLFFIGASAHAQLGGGAAKVRVFAPQMTCAQLKQTVANEGAVIIYSSRHIYDRYVATQSYCASGQITEWATVNASDDAKCFAGYICKYDDRGDR